MQPETEQPLLPGYHFARRKTWDHILWVWQTVTTGGVTNIRSGVESFCSVTDRPKLWILHNMVLLKERIREHTKDTGLNLEEDFSWTSMAEMKEYLPPISEPWTEKCLDARFPKRHFPECRLKLPVRKHRPVLCGRRLTRPLVSDWRRPLLPRQVSQWIKPDQCDSDGVLWTQ